MAQRVLYAQTETDPIWWVSQTHLVLLPLPFLLHHYDLEVVGSVSNVVFGVGADPLGLGGAEAVEKEWTLGVF